MEMRDLINDEMRENKVIQESIKNILTELGENPEREGLKRTPYRYAKACEEWFSGYKYSAPDVLNRQFSDTTDMVVEGPISFYSHCEHHIAPFYGEAWVGYIPDKYVTGLDKLVKLVEIYARRLQIQERLTSQVADGLFEYLECGGVMVVIKAKHLCVASRETRNNTTDTITSAVRGAFKEDKKTREEFLELMACFSRK